MDLLVYGKDVLQLEEEEAVHPGHRHEAARLVIDTGRPILQVAREIGGCAPLLGRWAAVERLAPINRRARSTLMSGPSWNGSGSRTPSCGWTGSS